MHVLEALRCLIYQNLKVGSELCMVVCCMLGTCDSGSDLTMFSGKQILYVSSESMHIAGQASNVRIQ